MEQILIESIKITCTMIITMAFKRYCYLNEFLESNEIIGDPNNQETSNSSINKRLEYRKRHKIPTWCIDTTDLHIRHYGKEDKHQLLKKRIKLIFWSLWTFYV